MNGTLSLLLVFPPNFAVDQPYLSVPALIAYLRKVSKCQVAQFDCNIDSFWYFLDQERLRSMGGVIAERRQKSESDLIGSSGYRANQYRSMCEAELLVAPVLSLLDESLDYFRRTPEQTTIVAYNTHLRVIYGAFKIVSAYYFPTRISPDEFSMRFSAENVREIIEATSSEENPYLDFFRDSVVPRIQQNAPDIVGISLASMSQIIPSYSLARLIRESAPETRVVFGGQVINRLTDRIVHLPELFDWVDYYVFHEGESALAGLIDYLSGKRAVQDVPNLIYCDAPDRIPTRSNHVVVEDISKLPPPDFSDLSLEKYLAPAPVLPYQPVRGCYWHRCTFCNHFVVHRGSDRAKSEEQVVTELAHLKDKYGTDYFSIINESIRPSLLKQYSDAMLSKALGIEWYVGARLEPALNSECVHSLKAAGCRKIFFGIETGSQRILNDMDKGIKLATARRVLINCGQAGIAVHLFIMLGFPTETVVDLDATKRFMVEIVSTIPADGLTYYLSIYQLKPCSKVFSSPAEFGITSIEESASDCDLEYLYNFEVGDRGGEIYYEQEKEEMEAALDEARDCWSFPENIVHYLTMYGFMERNQEKCTPVNLSPQFGTEHSLRPGLGLGTFSEGITGEFEFAKTNMQHHIIYDVIYDEYYCITDERSWAVLESMMSIDEKLDWRSNLRSSSLVDDNQIDGIVEKLVECGLVLSRSRVGTK